MKHRGLVDSCGAEDNNGCLDNRFKRQHIAANATLRTVTRVAKAAETDATSPLRKHTELPKDLAPVPGK